MSDIDKKIEVLTRLKRILVVEAKNLYEEIFLKYIESGKTNMVADYLNQAGHGVESPRGYRKYISTDVTEILESDEAKELVRKEIYILVMKIKKARKFRDKFMFELEGDENS